MHSHLVQSVNMNRMGVVSQGMRQKKETI